jgi:predicted Zn finger-like uncharacterized protein
MYTQCPECDTIFRVNAGVLRAAQGQVRCGVCDATFDAIRFLMDEIEAGVNAASASRIHLDPDPIAPSSPPLPPDPPPPSAPFLPSTHLPLVAFEVAEASNEWWATPVTTELPAFLLPPSMPSEPEADEPAPAALPATPITAEPSDAESPIRSGASEPFDTTLDRPITADGEPVASVIAAAEEDRFLHTAEMPQRRSSGLLPAVVAVVLGLLLAAQIIDHERGHWATLPVVGPALTQAYAALGRPIDPEWDVGAYDLRDWHAVPDTTTQTVRLRAKILNRGRRTQPWPVLRVIFEDRYGALVARRDFQPAEYLPGHPAAAGAMAPGTAVDADLLLTDPGASVAGFELDTCLPHGGAIGCGADLKGTHAE